MLLSIWPVGSAEDQIASVRLVLAVSYVVPPILVHFALTVCCRIAQDCGVDQLKLSGPERAALAPAEFHNRVRTWSAFLSRTNLIWYWC